LVQIHSGEFALNSSAQRVVSQELLGEATQAAEIIAHLFQNCILALIEWTELGRSQQIDVAAEDRQRCLQIVGGRDCRLVVVTVLSLQRAAQSNSRAALMAVEGPFEL
jgi:hypothetical protein